MKLPKRPPQPFGHRDFGRSLRTLRAYRNLGQRELSEISGFSYGAISKWERGVAGITQPNRQLLAESLRVPFDVFEALASGGDPLVKGLHGFGKLTVAEALLNYQQAAVRLGCCVNTVRKAVLAGVVTPRREFRVVLFNDADMKALAAWRREGERLRASRIRRYQQTKRGVA